MLLLGYIDRTLIMTLFKKKPNPADILENKDGKRKQSSYGGLNFISTVS